MEVRLVKIYKLKHVRKVDEKYNDTKLIGFFSSESKAKDNISYLKTKEGFVDYPNDFVIEECEIDDAISNNQIFYLTHSYEIDSGIDMISELGVFATEKEAYDTQQDWLKKDEAFKRHPEGFNIDNCILNKHLEWQDGFFAYE